MQLITIGLVSAVAALMSLGSAVEAATLAPSSILVAGIDAGRPTGSLAWAGENEAFASLAIVPVEIADRDVDVQLMTALAAPEPPAIVLAGMALGGVICGRSILRKRNKSTKETT